MGSGTAQLSQCRRGPHLAATIVLPREEVIVRTVRLPGVAEKDTASAIELQLDTLHPWDDTPIEWAWWRVTATDVVVGVVRQATLSEYETLFSEAGIPIAAATFSSAVIHAALRLQHAAPASFFVIRRLHRAAWKFMAKAKQSPATRRASRFLPNAHLQWRAPSCVSRRNIPPSS